MNTFTNSLNFIISPFFHRIQQNWCNNAYGSKCMHIKTIFFLRKTEVFALLWYLKICFWIVGNLASWCHLPAGVIICSLLNLRATLLVSSWIWWWQHGTCSAMEHCYSSEAFLKEQVLDVPTFHAQQMPAYSCFLISMLLQHL